MQKVSKPASEPKASKPSKEASVAKSTPAGKTQETTTAKVAQKAPKISSENIRICAYFLWEREGRTYGRDKEYWHCAEEQLKKELV